MEKFIFDNQDNLIRIAFTAPLIYAIVILGIRLVGKRSTSQMNSFDWIVTVAVGSLVSSTIILKSISILEGAFSIFLLLIMQLILTKILSYNTVLQKLVRATPQLLVYEGKYLEDNLITERVVKGEILSAIRHRGIQNISDVHAVVLETDSTFSVINNTDNNDCFTLQDVDGLPDGLKEDLEKRKAD